MISPEFRILAAIEGIELRSEQSYNSLAAAVEAAVRVQRNGSSVRVLRVHAGGTDAEPVPLTITECGSARVSVKAPGTGVGARV